MATGIGLCERLLNSATLIYPVIKIAYAYITTYNMEDFMDEDD